MTNQQDAAARVDEAGKSVAAAHEHDWQERLGWRVKSCFCGTVHVEGTLIVPTPPPPSAPAPKGTLPHYDVAGTAGNDQGFGVPATEGEAQ